MYIDIAVCIYLINLQHIVIVNMDPVVAGMSVGEIEMRPATLADREEILDIDRDQWGGNDYLSTNFHIIMHDPNIFAHVTLVDGEIVSH